jgi:hypothetical protein
MLTPFPQALREVHAAGQQPLAKTEALSQRHVQAGIQHEVIAMALHSLLANSRQQLRPKAAALELGADHQIIDVDETPVEQVFQLAVARGRFCGGLVGLFAGKPAPTGGVSALDYRTPVATKPALGGFCLASYLVGRGNLNRLSKLLIYRFFLGNKKGVEYLLEYLFDVRGSECVIVLSEDISPIQAPSIADTNPGN